jgi:localization factor PodJL
MKSGVPWNVLGVKPQTRDTARQAARRAGMPVGEWLDSLISDSAEADASRDRGADEKGASTSDPGVAAINQRIDELSRQVGQLARSNTDVSPPPPMANGKPDKTTSRRLADIFARAGRRQERTVSEPHSASSESAPAVGDRQTARADNRPAAAPRGPAPKNIDQVVAEIAARQRALDDELVPPSPPKPTNAPPHASVDVSRPQSPTAAVDAATRSAAPASPPAQARYADPVPRSSTQNAAGLEQLLRRITDQIETLRRPCAFEGVAESMRAQLSEITQMLHEALPRQALQALENDVRMLAERIDQTRHSGVDATALSGIEQGLAEVRDALHALTPAENLVGLDATVHELSQKIDLLAATHQDPEALRQLEAAIAGLHGVVAHVASNDALAKLTDEVRGLAIKIEHVTSSDSGHALMALENRVAMLTDALESRSRGSDALPPQLEAIVNSLADKIDHVASAGNGGALMALEDRVAKLADAVESRNRSSDAVPPQLEAIINSLSEKIESVQLSRSDHVALGHLENRIAKLVERLDASDARLGNLEAVERGLVDLLVHLEEMRGSNGSLRTGGSAPEPGVAPLHTDALGKEIDELKQTGQRTQDSLEDVHGTIDHVVDRLAMIEQGVHGHVDAPKEAVQPQTAAAVSPEPVTTPAPTAVSPEPEATPAPAAVSLEPTTPPAPADSPQAEAAPAPPSLSPAAMSAPDDSPPMAPQPAATPEPAPPAVAPRQPIDPSLPPDHPLEPGSGAARGRSAGTPAERIAASEAALAPTKPPVIPDPGGKPDFIAAARRAAQAAAAATPDRRPLAGEPPEPNRESLGKRLTKHMRSLFIAAAVAILAIGTIHVAKVYLAEPEAEAPQPQASKDPAPAAAPGPQVTAPPPAVSQTPSATAVPQPAEPPAVSPKVTTEPPADTPDPGARPRTEAPTDPSGKTAPPAGRDVTGSIPLPPAAPVARAAPTASVASATAAAPAIPSITASTPEPPLGADQSLVGLGGARLRTAAAKGDPAAAYEVAMRYVAGRGIPQNFAEAARWFERAAKHGIAPAQFRLGTLYEKGQGVRKDLDKAQRLYLAAAEKGHAKAMHNLAVLYAEGYDGKPDYRSAAQWFRTAANYGVADSQYNLGILYARGIGVSQNLAESYKWFALAARGGDKEAAKKRDDVAARLDPQSLKAARTAVQTWVAEPQPATATTVKTPPGGWDHSAAPAKPLKPARGRARVKASRSS